MMNSTLATVAASRRGEWSNFWSIFDVGNVPDKLFGRYRFYRTGGKVLSVSGDDVVHRQPLPNRILDSTTLVSINTVIFFKPLGADFFGACFRMQNAGEGTQRLIVQEFFRHLFGDFDFLPLRERLSRRYFPRHFNDQPVVRGYFNGLRYNHIERIA